MIITRLNGGLGNQLFQFAAARALSIHHQQPLLIDNRAFQVDGFRKFCLPLFMAEILVPSDTIEGQQILPPPRNHWIAFLKWRLTNGRTLQYIREKSLQFNPEILKAGPHCYLHGYWQSEQYFQHVAQQIRSDLTIRVKPAGENPEWLKRIASCVSVSVHVRRGDYVLDPKASRVHGTCSVEYYRRAAVELADRNSESPTFFVFSDDPHWAKENLHLPFTTYYLNHNDDCHHYEDLRLMTACRHHIIANSSFSWWGAWLGCNPDRIVIAPGIWFKDPSRSDQSLIPAKWIRL